MPFRALRFLSELRHNERVCLVLREHAIIPLLKVVFWMLFLFATASLETLIRTYVPLASEALPSAIIAVIRSVFIITAALGLLIVWVMYYLNVQIITNERIVDINQKSLLQHKTSELNLDRFQDVSTEMNGPLPNLFNYGNVRVQTAGEMENFIFENIPDPHHVAKIILELYEQIRKERPQLPHE
ncbi:MAG: PH domain-containing protein [Patescibacteria group bacterium]|nr:PH domain-containing protein [Patescibacteria group bacterium]